MSEGPGSDMPEPLEPVDPTAEMAPIVDEADDEKIPAWAWWLFGVAIVAIIFLVWYAVANSTDAENAPIAEPTVSAEPSDSPTPMPSPTDVPTSEPSDSPTPMPSPTDVPTSEPSDTPTPMPSPTDIPPSTSFTDGAFVGGTDVEAGTYRTTAEVTAGKCAWAISGVVDGDPATTPPLGVPSGGIPTVTLAKGATIVTKGCGTWETVDPTSLFGNAQAKAVLTDGVWLAGEDVRPGTYTTDTIPPGTIPEKLCRWTVTTGLESNFSQVVVRGFVTEGAGKVAIEDGQQIESTNCGDWIALTK